jgi:ketosteroid isomerase-like protein
MRFSTPTFAALSIAALTFVGAHSPSPTALTERTSPSLSLTGTDAITPFSLPTLISTENVEVNTRNIEAIRATLALYPLAIDGKNFDALSRIFAQDAVANYSAPLNVLSPLSTIQSVLKSSLNPVTTQHSFGTQLIDILSQDSAFSVTYYTATHFGRGIFEGKTATAFGQYQDVWKKQQDGKWKITHRNLVYMVSRSRNSFIESPISTFVLT